MDRAVGGNDSLCRGAFPAGPRQIGSCSSRDSRQGAAAAEFRFRCSFQQGTIDSSSRRTPTNGGGRIPWSCGRSTASSRLLRTYILGKRLRGSLSLESSVSEAIRTLEHEVGGPLFVRTSRRVQLTPLGEKLRRGVEPAALVLRSTLEDCRKIALGQSSRVRIGFLGRRSSMI